MSRCESCSPSISSSKMVLFILILATISVVHSQVTCDYIDNVRSNSPPSASRGSQPTGRASQTVTRASPTISSPSQTTSSAATNKGRNNLTIGVSDWGPYEEIIAERKEFPTKHIDNVAYRGKLIKDYRLSLRDMNVFVRESYAEMIQKIGFNLFPLIIATDAEPGFPGVGSTFTLFLEDGTSRRIVPAPPAYEVYKNLAHLPLGMFAIISPYFNAPTSTGWQEKLRKFQKFVQYNLDAARKSGWTEEVQCKSGVLTLNDQMTMLWHTDQYIENCFEKKSIDQKDYDEYTSKFTSYVVKALQCASEMQVDAAIPQLEAWKKELGPAKWRDLYVLIPVQTPSARRNTREQIFEGIMDQDRLKTHIMKIENVKDFDEARKALGRIVGDRSWAHFLFGSIKGKQDVNAGLNAKNNVGIYHQPIP